MSNDNFSFLSKVDRLALIGQGNTAEIYDYGNFRKPLTAKLELI